ncbi:hypothetical protein S7711_05390 [Stachybotrys chartarum IBT 7711]|uniref:Peptidase S33 tripeptidyl aminopeptidase-like C-terminal domain-containing protein n=1 Tax=Stachybotrys chartarum (strain CBS 109288 / IBT 7711) TaxID=1280523 RepID=A0A084AHF7_STACB|nr:hypothetical protein S7711_05390 [Stachybotrys chartarum IBT 7711]KFA53008.1 hypothetical protein S40293_05918 [Stachybotrys chartarum IBT 40293]
MAFSLILMALSATLSSAVPLSGNWSSILPSPDIHWHPCYNDTLQCTRLLLPLDWPAHENTTTSPPLPPPLSEQDATVAIAIIKLPAAVPRTHPTYAGPIFTNPGGPGGSGVDFLLRLGRYLQRVVDKPGTRRYDVVSFDPRGVGLSTPAVDCFADNPAARDALFLEGRGTWGLDRGDSAITYSKAVMQAYGQRCKNSKGARVLAYVGTPSVARDIVAMADKIDEERRRSIDADTYPAHANTEQRQLELKRSIAPDPQDVVRVQYMGFSYGTILGNYLASMFPGRVGRMLLDGVCDINDYVSGPGWLNHLYDTDELFDTFLHGCHLAGPSLCALAISSDSSSLDLRERLLDFLTSLDTQPQAVLSSDSTIVILSGNDVRTLIGYSLYSPLTYFQSFSKTLSAAMTGNLTVLADALLRGGYIPNHSSQATCSAPGPLQGRPTGIEGLHAVLCSDAIDVTSKDTAWWSDYIRKQLSFSSIFGAYWASLRFACAGWRFRANWSFKGPFTTPAPDSRRLAERPEAPILFLTSRLDPVTPLSNARLMAANHHGAAVVIQESLGHTALISAPSRCTARIVADYFHLGTVPGSEMSCQEDCGPWDADCHLFNHESSQDMAAAHLLDATALRAFRQDQQQLRLLKHPLGVL